MFCRAYSFGDNSLNGIGYEPKNTLITSLNNITVLICFRF